MINKIVLDASLLVDLFAGRDERRVETAEAVFRCLQKKEVKLFAPKLLFVELAGVLVRFIPPKEVSLILSAIRNAVIAVADEVFYEEAIELALSTGSRGADSYYMGLAKIMDAVLVTSDKVQALNAKRAGLRSFYVLHEKESLLNALGCPE